MDLSWDGIGTGHATWSQGPSPVSSHRTLPLHRPGRNHHPCFQTRELRVTCFAPRLQTQYLMQISRVSSGKDKSPYDISCFTFSIVRKRKLCPGEFRAHPHGRLAERATLRSLSPWTLSPVLLPYPTWISPGDRKVLSNFTNTGAVPLGALLA